MKIEARAIPADAERMAAAQAVLDELVQAARLHLGDELVAVVLFGSAAEDRLRADSDVNLLLLLKSFSAAHIDALRESLRLAHAAARVETMFLLEAELPAAAELFAVKFNDIRARHRLLHGADPFSALRIDAAELRRQLREVLLNLAIRLRERYALISLCDEQLARVLAEAAGPLRAAAVALLDLRGEGQVAPREALERIAATTGEASFIDAVALLPLARQQRTLPPGVGGPALLALSRLASHLREALEAGTP